MNLFQGKKDRSRYLLGRFVYMLQRLIATAFLNQMCKTGQAEPQICSCFDIYSTLHLDITRFPHKATVCKNDLSATFVASFVFNYHWLREFLLSAFGNRLELSFNQWHLMLLCDKICLCYDEDFPRITVRLILPHFDKFKIFLFQGFLSFATFGFNKLFFNALSFERYAKFDLLTFL